MLFNSLLLIFLILIGGLATGIEAAMLSIDKIEIKRRSKNGDKRATRLLKIKENPTSFLATIQMCITLTSLLASAFAAETFASYFMRLLNVNADVEATLRNIIIIIITMVLSYVSLIFGELLPKKIGINKPEQVVYDSIGIIEYLMKAFRPFILFLTASTNFFMKLFRIKETPDEKFDEDKFKKLIIYSKHEGVINDEEAQVMLNMFEFGDIDIKSVMRLFSYYRLSYC